MTFIRYAATVALLICTVTARAGDFSNNPEVAQFVAQMVKKHGFNEQRLVNILAQAEKKQAILEAISRPAEKTKPWYEYRRIFLGEDRVQQGVDFWQHNAAALASLSKKYGVEPELIVAIIGVETRYGRYMGNYRVLDALTTLGFHYPKRGKFFRAQLEAFFVLTEKHKLAPTGLMGSYAGAMGLGQFIPSSYLHYARHHSGDGFADIWSSQEDAIASVANYFKAHGWQSGKPVFASLSTSKNTLSKKFASKIPTGAAVNSGDKPSQTLGQWRQKGFITNEKVADDALAVMLSYDFESGPQYLFGLHNFYVITRYNRSRLYARAVWELSQAIKAGFNSGGAPVPTAN